MDCRSGNGFLAGIDLFALARYQIGGGFGARLKRDPARLVGNEAHASFNIHQELAVAVGADQLDHMIKRGVARERFQRILRQSCCAARGP